MVLTRRSAGVFGMTGEILCTISSVTGAPYIRTTSGPARELQYVDARANNKLTIYTMYHMYKPLLYRS